MGQFAGEPRLPCPTLSCNRLRGSQLPGSGGQDKFMETYLSTSHLVWSGLESFISQPGVHSLNHSATPSENASEPINKKLITGL